jgi:3'-phosphoadenosine 5'-phosphosulfate sulfotransferase (PAPS reductase)/FAD synthetase
MDWCTRELKINPLKKYLKQYNYEKIYHYIGIAYDEPKRVKST